MHFFFPRSDFSRLFSSYEVSVIYPHVKSMLTFHDRASIIPCCSLMAWTGAWPFSVSRHHQEPTYTLRQSGPKVHACDCHNLQCGCNFLCAGFQWVMDVRLIKFPIKNSCYQIFNQAHCGKQPQMKGCLQELMNISCCSYTFINMDN